MRHSRIFYTAIALFSLGFTACEKNFLDRPPLDVVGEDAAYGSQAGVEALTASLYGNVQVEDHNFMIGTGYLSMMADE